VKGEKMKAIIEIELEIDGEWAPGDKETLEMLISENPSDGVWIIDEDRLAVLSRSMTVRIEGGV
jgi:anti-anti-sigma regulatory factor